MHAHCNKYILTVIIILSFILACMLQIRVNFLPVGHTHEDVDQFFSKISAHLSRVGAETIFIGILKSIYKKMFPLIA